MGVLKKWEIYEVKENDGQRSWKRRRRENRNPPFFLFFPRDGGWILFFRDRENVDQCGQDTCRSVELV